MPAQQEEEYKGREKERNSEEDRVARGHMNTTSELFARIATELSEVDLILQQIAVRSRRERRGAQKWEMPRTLTEEVLAQVWGQVLHYERVGIRDSIFELGGHSLLAIQLLSRVSDAFGVDLPLNRLFEMPTVAGMATLLAEYSGDPDGVEQTAQMLLDLAYLSDEEAEAMFAEDEEAEATLEEKDK